MELLKMKPGIRIWQWRAREELGLCVAQLIESLPFRGDQNGVFGIEEFHISVCYFTSKRKSNTNAARDLKLLLCRNRCLWNSQSFVTFEEAKKPLPLFYCGILRHCRKCGCRSSSFKFSEMRFQQI